MCVYLYTHFITNPEVDRVLVSDEVVMNAKIGKSLPSTLILSPQQNCSSCNTDSAPIIIIKLTVHLWTHGGGTAWTGSTFTIIN